MTAKKISKKLSKELQNLENMGPDAHAVEVQKELDAEEKRKNALGRADERIKRSKVSSGTISMYLSEISQYEPLSPDREVELAVLIWRRDWNKFVSEFTNLINPEYWLIIFVRKI